MKNNQPPRDEDDFRLDAYTSEQLSAQYRVDRRTFRNWLKPFADKIGAPNGYLFTPAQVEIIYDCLGLPGKKYREK